MESLVAHVDSYGLALVFALGFVEYAGVPIASVPFLVAAGALARTGALDFALVVPLAAAGGLLADAAWYAVARRGGPRLVGAACSLSPNPRSCVLTIEEKVLRVGAPYILSAKFLPGAGNLIAPAAGFGGFPAIRFLTLDAIALFLWAFAYSGLGWLLSDQVEAAIEGVEAYTAWVLAAFMALVVVGAAYRYLKVKRHAHGAAPEDTES